ncbi:hypothetical protein [uncultured Chryseobacterium sp.]|uniref:type IX secretion system anionic LPS delivery protein PorZ n=1 Tax=uncultured Chryseobacterium sp. TaxID=259322 RepID=UPI002614505C|nr:hypothetical protein [uncultured Chryseobacterium sp.]
MKKLVPFLALIFGLGLNAQIISSSKWTDLFSYNNVLCIREDAGKLIAATENGIFYYTPSSGEITKLSKANGLHEVKISAFDYNAETKIGLVGYINGTMDVITPDGITYVVDIPLATGYTGSKKINHISITGNQAVISVGYGISIFNLNKKEFGDSSFFMNAGVFEAAKESVIKDNKVYAITSTGIKTHDINVTIPIYAEWTTVAAGTFNNIDIENGVIAYSSATQAFYGDGTTFTPLSQSFSNVKDIAVTPQNIIIADQNSVSALTLTGTPVKNYTSPEVLNTAWFNNSQIYAGSYLAGILNENSQSFKPDGPYANRSYKINLLKDKIWVSTGVRENRYNHPQIDPRNLGFYFFNGKEWIYPSYFINNPIAFNVLDAVANPSNDKEVFLANYVYTTGKGFFKMNYNETSKDFNFVKFYPTPNDSYNRPVGFTYDDKNNLFASVAFYYPASTMGVYYYDKSSDSFISKGINAGAAQKPIFYEGKLWIPAPRSNTFAVVDTKGTTSFSDDTDYVLSESNGLPSGGNGTLSVTIDNTGDAWIGTDNGLRVLPNASSEIANSPKLEPIIIEQNGLGEELFRDAQVLQIEVDSGNQKWVSIDGGGVFYLNPNGEKTFLHFTKENSPLPTNSATDIKVDNKTGKVYFVTLDGIVVYQGDAVNVTENFGDVLVYPNPVVYANYKGNVKIKGLAEKTNIRITDAAGNLVHQAVARGGYYEWDLNFKGKRVASGIYFVLMTNADGTDKATAKIAVVN